MKHEKAKNAPKYPPPPLSPPRVNQDHFLVKGKTGKRLAAILEQMIISASRRTDIPAYYSDWFCKRINEGFVSTRNPMNFNQTREITLSPDIVDCIVFWSKNPEPLIAKLDVVKDYAYYFQFTLNSYGSDVEVNLPAKSKRIETFMKLSDKIGCQKNQKIIWRYDPILLNDIYTIDYHIDNFGETALKLRGYTQKVIFSFIDFYKKIEANITHLKIKPFDDDDKNKIAKNFSVIAESNGFLIETCAESIDLSSYGISHARCIDYELISRIKNCGTDIVKINKDKNQRPECGCAAAVDIGFYNSCQNACLYCYANSSAAAVKKNITAHNQFSPMMIG
ncbi:MAG: DUF1848 domain-containing protein [Spirochaetaceae bacterium]|nr:DUF1848 domain-containing protein [Spirochaetaceae bacterium]